MMLGFPYRVLSLDMFRYQLSMHPLMMVNHLKVISLLDKTAENLAVRTSESQVVKKVYLLLEEGAIQLANMMKYHQAKFILK